MRPRRQPHRPCSPSSLAAILPTLYASNTLLSTQSRAELQRCVVVSKVAGGPRRSQRPCTTAAGRAAGAEPEAQARKHPSLILARDLREGASYPRCVFFTYLSPPPSSQCCFNPAICSCYWALHNQSCPHIWHAVVHLSRHAMTSPQTLHCTHLTHMVRTPNYAPRERAAERACLACMCSQS